MPDASEQVRGYGRLAVPPAGRPVPSGGGAAGAPRPPHDSGPAVATGTSLRASAGARYAAGTRPGRSGPSKQHVLRLAAATVGNARSFREPDGSIRRRMARRPACCREGASASGRTGGRLVAVGVVR
jgi:hypothetical protein